MAGGGSLREVTRSGYWREEEARVVVDAWRASGKTVTEFSRSYGIAAARLARWASRLGEPAVRFHPVRLTEAREEPGAAVIEIELRNGTVVRLPAGFAIEDLRRILSALAAGTAC